jgi:hypothetical protein
LILLDLLHELHSLVRVLEEHKIEYALCGGMAMGVHGHARTTAGIELLIVSESLPDVLEVAKTLGYTIRGKDLSFANGAVEIRRVSKMDPDDGKLLSLDLLLATPDVRDVWEERTVVEWEGGRLSVVTARGLITIKQLRRSYQDLADIEALTGGHHEEG